MILPSPGRGLGKPARPFVTGGLGRFPAFVISWLRIEGSSAIQSELSAESATIQSLDWIARIASTADAAAAAAAALEVKTDPAELTELLGAINRALGRAHAVGQIVGQDATADELLDVRNQIREMLEEG